MLPIIPVQCMGMKSVPLSLPEFQPETNMGSSQLGRLEEMVNYDQADCAFPFNHMSALFMVVKATNDCVDKSFLQYMYLLLKLRQVTLMHFFGNTSSQFAFTLSWC